ncbi:MAG: AMP-binding protein [Pseudomonadota bacterium]
MSLYRRLCGHAQFQPDKPAIESEAGILTYHQLHVLTDQCADYFVASGLQRGDRIAILALNHPDWFIVLFAAAKLGIMVVPLNWRLSVDELRFMTTDCEPQFILHDAEFADAAGQLVDADQCIAIGHNDFPPQAEPCNATSPGSASADSELLIVYTSGTTGQPKGAVLTQKALLCSAEMSQHMVDLTATDRVLNVLPLFHVGGLNIQPLPALLYGATLVSHQRFDPQRAIASLAGDGITLMNSVPTLLQAILATDQWQTANLHTLRAFSIGSTDVPLPLIQAVHKKGIPLIQVYGATEMAPVAIYQRIEHAKIEGTIGRAGVLNDIRLVNDQGQPVACGESGEIQVRGNNLLTRYWNNTAATDAAITDDWFGSGDVAHCDDKGFYWFDDRLKHVIISGGENIYPAELERLIRELPGVAEVAVVGKPDDQWGEVPYAVVVKSSADVQSDTVMATCAGIARFKQPKGVLFVDALPRNALGKVVVPEVKALL